MTGRTAVVTGASRGLGAAIAKALAKDGAWVALGCRSRVEDAEGVLAEIRANGGDGAVVAFDVRDNDAARDALGAIERARGGIDVLVANAGVVREGFFAMDGAAPFDEVIAVDLVGTANTIRAVTRGMITRGRGAVVVIGSVAGRRGAPGQAAYAAAKGGLEALVRSLGAELAPRGVRVNAVIPGMLDTGMARRMRADSAARFLSLVPLGRAGTADEAAAAVVFLASDAAAYIVGHAIVVDGGLSL